MVGSENRIWTLLAMEVTIQIHIRFYFVEQGDSHVKGSFAIPIIHKIHVRYIHLDLVDLYGICR